MLRQIKVTSDPKSSFFEGKGRMNLVKYNELENLVSGDLQANILLDLFLAGGETSATTLAWSVVHMVRHPDVQVNSTNFVFHIC